MRWKALASRGRIGLIFNKMNNEPTQHAPVTKAHEKLWQLLLQRLASLDFNNDQAHQLIADFCRDSEARAVAEATQDIQATSNTWYNNWIVSLAERDAAVKRAEAAEAREERHFAHIAVVIKERDALRAHVSALREALEKMQRDIPASDQSGGLYVVHFDGDGNEIGTEPVDPIAVVGHLSSRISEALTFAATASVPPADKKEDAP